MDHPLSISSLPPSTGYDAQSISLGAPFMCTVRSSSLSLYRFSFRLSAITPFLHRPQANLWHAAVCLPNASMPLRLHTADALLIKNRGANVYTVHLDDSVRFDRFSRATIVEVGLLN